MNTDKIQQLKEQFEAAAQEHQEIEFWFARDLQKLLGYTECATLSKSLKKLQKPLKTAN